MERGNVVVIAIVVAALALFSLRFFGSDPEEDELAGLTPRERIERLAQRSGDGAAPGDRRVLGPDGRPVAGGRPGTGGTRTGAAGANGAAGHGGSAGSVYGASGSAGGTLGTSGSSRTGGAGGAAGMAGADPVGRIAPKAERRADLVESLGSRPPTQSDLDKPVPVDNGEDVALKVNTTQDISDQNGQAVGEVKDADEGDEGIKVEPNTRVEFPNAGNASKEGTISFTLKPDWSGADATDNSLVQIRQEHEWNNGLEIVKNGEFLRALIRDNTGREADISYRISDWPAGEERVVEFSWGEGRTELTVNDQVVGRNEYPGELEFREGTPMIFGADHPGSNYGSASATISKFTVGKTPLFTQ